MPQNILGEARRSNCLANFGPGAVAEFRDKKSGAAMSGVVAGLEAWPKNAPQLIYERRLQSVLDVEVFRLPPVDSDGELHLSAFRFPDWQHCPECNRVRPAAECGNMGVGEPALLCRYCTNEARNIFVAPVRFVVTCEHSHLQDFPWDKWVAHAASCKAPDLRLEQSTLAGLAGLKLRCENCGAGKSFEDAFKQTALTGITACNGSMRWLGVAARVPSCRRVPRVVQRGASNLYFPVILSSLSIPPFTEPLQTALNPHWPRFANKPPEKWPMVIEALDLVDSIGATEEEILAAVRRSMDALGASEPKALRHEEFMKFESGVSVPGDTDFEIRKESVPPELASYFSSVIRAVRLREVKAQRGFTRLDPPNGEAGQATEKTAPLSYGNLNWLPAIEMRGEGIFLRFNEDAVSAWEKGEEVEARRAKIDAAYRANWLDRFGTESPPPRIIEARYILVHTFAHALIRELTLACGYSSASLRERLYADRALKMAGVLIYTATTDSDGSLGGLERQGRTTRIGPIVHEAIRKIVWCSNDPLCIEDTSMFSDAQNLAACHACVLAPETSCEDFNVFLDRAMLVGKPAMPQVGFFEPLLAPDSEI